jgi:hypothetical protein
MMRILIDIICIYPYIYINVLEYFLFCFYFGSQKRIWKKILINSKGFELRLKKKPLQKHEIRISGKHNNTV